MADQPTVWVITDDPNKNMQPAEKFGKLEVLFPYGTMVGLSAGKLIDQIKRKLSTISSKDFILCTGDPAIIGAVCMVAGHYLEGRIKILRWEKRCYSYQAIEIEVE